MSLFRFYVLVLLAVVAAFAQAWTQDEFKVAIFVAILGWFLTVVFSKFDDRTKALLKLSEAPLKYVEERFNNEDPNVEWSVITKSDHLKAQPGHMTYGDLFRLMHWTFRVSFLVLGVFAASQIEEVRALVARA